MSPVGGAQGVSNSAMRASMTSCCHCWAISRSSAVVFSLADEGRAVISSPFSIIFGR